MSNLETPLRDPMRDRIKLTMEVTIGSMNAILLRDWNPVLRYTSSHVLPRLPANICNLSGGGVSQLQFPEATTVQPHKRLQTTEVPVRLFVYDRSVTDPQQI